MTIESIKARLEDRCAQCPLMPGIPLCRECPDADLRALLKVAKAAKEYVYGSDGDERVDYSALCTALAELEGME